MPPSKTRLREVLTYRNDYGMDKAIDKFGLSHDSIKRYDRWANELNMDNLTQYETPNILLFDIESSPREYYTWRPGKQYVNSDRMIKDSAILTYSAKWLCDDTIMSAKVDIDKARKREDKEICKSLWQLLDKADVLIAHNLKGFDEPYVKTRFIVNELKPPSKYRRIDTYRGIKKEFKFPSNSLDFLTKKFGIAEKQDVRFELWERCITGDKNALEEMLAYNKQDVRGLEDLYMEVRGWIKSPNLALYYEDPNGRCPNCGSRELEFNGKYTTNVNIYKSMQCQECGAFSRERHTSLPEHKKRDLVTPVAR